MITSIHMKWVRISVSLILILLTGPVAVAIGGEGVTRDWRTATRQSSGIAPKPGAHPDAVVQVYAARAFSWRGAFAVHTWILNYGLTLFLYRVRGSLKL